MAIATTPRRTGRARTRRLDAAASRSDVDAADLGRAGYFSSDTFLDTVVLVSVVMFMLLAVGVAMLALQATTLA